MSDNVIAQAIENVRAKSKSASPAPCYPVTINFHPDRYTSNNEPLLSAIAKDGRLKSQFETDTSNGGLTAYKGGDRWVGLCNFSILCHAEKYLLSASQIIWRL